MLKVIKKTRIHEEVFSQIHELIKQGRLKARDQLPSERELAETFKVSRTSVREALRSFESQGLIVSRTGMGNFVVDLPVHALVGPLARLLIDDKSARADRSRRRRRIGFVHQPRHAKPSATTVGYRIEGDAQPQPRRIAADERAA